MSACLSERRLLQCYSGAGRGADAAHLRGCAECTERFAQLRDDLERIGDVLSAPPPAIPQAHRAPWFQWGWTAAVATAVVLAAIVVGLARPRASRPTRTVAAPAANTSDFSSELDAALFASGEVGALPSANDEVAYLQAALGGGWPCTREEMLNGECDGPVYALLADDE